MVSNCYFYSVRHSITIVPGTRNDANGNESGEIRGFTQMNCTIKECSSAGLDTHAGCIHPMFIGNYVAGKSVDPDGALNPAYILWKLNNTSTTGNEPAAFLLRSPANIIMLPCRDWNEGWDRFMNIQGE